MRFPYRVKDLKDAQKNFDWLGPKLTSLFPQLLVPQVAGLQMQVFSITAAQPLGTAGVTVNLPTPFKNTHVYDLVTVSNAPGGNWGVPAATPLSLTQLNLFMSNNPVAQNITWSVMAFGT